MTTALTQELRKQKQTIRAERRTQERDLANTIDVLERNLAHQERMKTGTAVRDTRERIAALREAEVLLPWVEDVGHIADEANREAERKRRYNSYLKLVEAALKSG